jgi:polyhydroxyalkanoate synthase
MASTTAPGVETPDVEAQRADAPAFRAEGEPLVAMPTPRDRLFTDGPAALWRFRGAEPPAAGRYPVLLVPSMINRWYVLDLHREASVAATLVDAGLDVYLLDWGTAGDEDRYLEWDAVLERLARMVRAVKRIAGVPQLGILGYCMGATLAAIHSALHPAAVAALVNLAGPIDFAEGGVLRHMIDRRWFDLDAIVDAGNVTPLQMQSGFVAMRPTNQLSKMVRMLDPDVDEGSKERARVLEQWANDNVPFPAAAYRRYIGDLYRDNQLARGEHRVAGRAVDLKAIRCPVLTITAERDEICPPPAALALNRLVGSQETDALQVPGGHVGAVVGSRARRELYPRLADWLCRKLTIERDTSALVN